MELIRMPFHGVKSFNHLKEFKSTRLSYFEPKREIGLREIILTNDKKDTVIVVRMNFLELGERWDIVRPEIHLFWYEYFDNFDKNKYKSIDISGFDIKILELIIDDKIIESGIQFNLRQDKYMVIPSSSPMSAALLHFQGSTLVDYIGQESEYSYDLYKASERY